MRGPRSATSFRAATKSEVRSSRRLRLRRGLAAILIALSAARVVLTPIILFVALVVALIPPVASMIRTLRQSERRNEILSELAKYQEHLREAAEAAPTLRASQES